MQIKFLMREQHDVERILIIRTRVSQLALELILFYALSRELS